MTQDVEQRVRQARSSLKRLKDRLDQLGYVFERPEDALATIDSADERIVSRIESEVGPVPGALLAFWRVVGSVDFCGSHPEWRGCEYSDPIVVLPPRYAEPVLDEFLEDRAAYLETYGSFLIPIAPDRFHKENVGGGPAYGVAVPGEREDPPLLEEPNETTFLGYLDLATTWGGFPGLMHRTETHTWPIESLRGSLD